MAPTAAHPDRHRPRDVTVAEVGRAPVSRAASVVTEEPLEIRIDGRPLAVVMRTPGDDLELAAGFLKAEGVVRDADDIAMIAHCRDPDEPDLGNVINVTLEDARRTSAEARLAERYAERSTVTSVSCGVCGKRTIASIQVDAPPFETTARIEPEVVAALPDRLRAAQTVFDATGGLHGVALFTAAGDLVVAREDVGRHNAVDKVVGAMLLTAQAPPDGSILMVSGRTSYEIVQKALMARIQIVAAVSAPSSLAVELAEASRMTLMGFVRGAAFNLYAGVLLD